MFEPVSEADPTMEVFCAQTTDAGARLDFFLATKMPEHVSRSRTKQLIKDGHVSVDGASNIRPNYRLKGNEQISLTVPEPQDSVPGPEEIPLDVLYEDEELIVINKAAGMVVHPAAGNWHGTLVNALIHHCAGSLSGIGGVRRPGIVHRLDKDTSGVMVVAKTDRAHAGLTAQFADHGRTGPLQRSYLALVWGVPQPLASTVDSWLARSGSCRIKQAVVKPERPGARRAVTHYQVLQTLPVGTAAPLASLLECRLETGRTHQIRVHMAAIAHPLIGDMVYGSHFKTKSVALDQAQRQALKSLNRQALHAAQLAFEHPGCGLTMAFDAPPPADFATLAGLMGLKPADLRIATG